MMGVREQDVLACSAEIRAVLPDLVNKYIPGVLMAALSEQVAHYLFRIRQSHECTAEEVRELIERVRQKAFAR